MSEKGRKRSEDNDAVKKAAKAEINSLPRMSAADKKREKRQEN